VSGSDLNLRIIGVEPAMEVAGARWLTINTTRGAIPMILHSAAEAGRSVLCLSGAIGGFDGPATLYARLGSDMPRRGITIARIDYREPNEFGECVLDALAALTFLKGTGHRRTTLIGHSFGGAVAINAGTLGSTVSGVIAISSQLAGAHVAGDLAPKPLLLIHGTADTILSHQCSEMIYERAGEPKQIRLFPNGGHILNEVADDLTETVESWLEQNS
jgi:pimeloyl-ACP methyl ester carboxylesterase